jgi:hypothetical protein
MRSAAGERDAGSEDTGGGKAISIHLAILALYIREKTSSEKVLCMTPADSERFSIT